MRLGDLRLLVRQDFRYIAGLLTNVYAVAVYPVLGIWAGDGLMAGPMFGVASRPIMIFTLGDTDGCP